MEMYLKLLLICGFVAASESFGCIDNAAKSANNGMMMGGWEKMDLGPSNTDKEMKDTVKHLAETALELEEQRSNDLNTNYQLTNVKSMEVYTHVVKGLKYCLQFQAKSTKCKNGVEKCTPRQRTCVAEVYQPPGSELLTMDQPNIQKNFKVKCT